MEFPFEPAYDMDTEIVPHPFICLSSEKNPQFSQKRL